MPGPILRAATTVRRRGGLLRFVIEFGAGLLGVIVFAACAFARDLGPRARRAIVFALACGALIGVHRAWILRDAPPRTGITRSLMFHHHVVVDRPVAAAWALPLVLAILFVCAAIWIARGWRPGGERRPWVAPFVLGLGVIAGRFALDRAAAPEPVAHAVGLLWWGVALGPYLQRSGVRVGATALRLAFATRLVVVGLNVLATRCDWGTHFSLARVERVALPFVDTVFMAPPGSVRQFLGLVVLPQLVIWPMLTALIAVLAARGFELVRFRR